MFGNRADAAVAFNMFHHQNVNPWGGETPEGWRNLSTGSSCSRLAALHEASGVVYKVESVQDYAPRGDRMHYSNRGEYLNGVFLNRMTKANDYWYGAYVRIPRVGGFAFPHPWDEPNREPRYRQWVVAMQYVEGNIGAGSNEARQELLTLGFRDMHAFNFIEDEAGSIWPIDLGSDLGLLDPETLPDQRVLYNTPW